MRSSDARRLVGIRAVTTAVWADNVGNATVYWTAARSAGRSWRARSETVVLCCAGFRDAAQPAIESPAKAHENVREMTGIVDTSSCRRREGTVCAPPIRKLWRSRLRTNCHAAHCANASPATLNRLRY